MNGFFIKFLLKNLFVLVFFGVFVFFIVFVFVGLEVFGWGFIFIFFVKILGKMFCFCLIVIVMDLVWGYCGIFSFGYFVFFGFGGYMLGMWLMYVCIEIIV